MVSILPNQPHRIRFIQRDQIIETGRSVRCSTGNQCLVRYYSYSIRLISRKSRKSTILMHISTPTTLNCIYSANRNSPTPLKLALLPVWTTSLSGWAPIASNWIQIKPNSCVAQQLGDCHSWRRKLSHLEIHQSHQQHQFATWESSLTKNCRSSRM